MHKFIGSFAGDRQLDFRYGEYDCLFLKQNYNSYYLFFFLEDKGQLVTLQKEAGNIFQAIKQNRALYQPDMEKNITCVLCLRIEENEYYGKGANREISDLSKVICLVEEDLNYFKKNVFLYTEKMEKFARKNIGRFESVCQEYLTEKNFQTYKKSNKDIIEYDFLINLFIKIPFLSFHGYHLENKGKYQTMSAFIEAKCKDIEIDYDYIDGISEQLEKNLEDENKLYEWLDTLIDKQTDQNKSLVEVREDED